MAYRPGMFDVSNFISPFRGDPIGAQKMQANVWSDASQNAIAAGQLFQQMKRAKAQQELERQAIGQRANTAFMQQQHADARTQAALDQRREAARLKLEREQAVAGGELAGEAAKAFAAGDENALIGIQSRAQMLDPMLRMTLPGAAPQPRVDPNLPSVDEVYPNDPNALTIERGGQQLYGETRDAARQREQDVLGRMLSPLSTSPFASWYKPSVEMGMGVAGSGMSAGDAAKMALEQGRFEVGQLNSNQRAETMAGATKHRMGMQETNQDIAVFDRIEKMGESVKRNFGIVDAEKQTAGLSELNDMITKGVPFAQNEGLLLILKNTIRGAGSDKDMNQFEGAAGFWEKLERDVNKVIAGGAMPEGFKNQIAATLAVQKQALESKRNRAGLAFRDQIYNETMLPLTDDQRVMAAGRKFSEITGRQLSPEDLQKELARYRSLRARGPAIQSSTPGGRSTTVESSSSFSGAPAGESLGVTGGRPPAIPRVAPDYDVNAEADDLLGEDIE